jgi:hypothetical protein
MLQGMRGVFKIKSHNLKRSDTWKKWVFFNAFSWLAQVASGVHPEDKSRHGTLVMYTP